MISNHGPRKLATSVLGDVAAGRSGPPELASLLRAWAGGGITVGVLETGWCAVLFTVLLLAWPAAGVTAGAYLAGMPGEVAGLGVAGVVMSAPLFALFTDSPRLNLVTLLTATVPLTLLAGVAAAWWAVLGGPRRSDVLLSAAQARAAGVSVWWPAPLRVRAMDAAAGTAAACLADLMNVAEDAADWLTADAVHATGVAARTMEATAGDLRAAAGSAAVRAAGALAGTLSSWLAGGTETGRRESSRDLRFPPVDSEGQWAWCPSCGCDHREDARAGADVSAGACGCLGHYGHGREDGEPSGDGTGRFTA